MRLLTAIGLLLGLAAVAALVAWQGAAAVAHILVSLGWGVALLPLAWLPYLLLSAASWRGLFVEGRSPPYPHALRALWMGWSVNTLLPVASIGGEVVKARLLNLWGCSGADAGASVVLDKTVQAVAVAGWGLIGLGALVSLRAQDEVVAATLLFTALLAAAIAGFVVVQRAGMLGYLARSAAKLTAGSALEPVTSGAAAVDGTIRALYERPGRILLSSLLRIAANVALTLDVWLAATLMGHPISLLEALMLKSLTGALRGAAFVVPNGLGIQEGGFVVLGALLGQSPEFMLALSLAGRAREMLVSLPGLVAWQHAEGKALWRRLSRNAAETGRPARPESPPRA